MTVKDQFNVSCDLGEAHCQEKTRLPTSSKLDYNELNFESFRKDINYCFCKVLFENGHAYFAFKRQIKKMMGPSTNLIKITR